MLNLRAIAYGDEREDDMEDMSFTEVEFARDGEKNRAVSPREMP